MDHKQAKPVTSFLDRCFLTGEAVIGCGAGVWWPARIEQTAAAGIAAGDEPSYFESCAAAQNCITGTVKTYLLRFVYLDGTYECCKLCLVVFCVVPCTFRVAAWASVEDVMPLSALTIAWAHNELDPETKWNKAEFDASLRILLSRKTGREVNGVPFEWLTEPPTQLCSSKKDSFTGEFLFAC